MKMKVSDLSKLPENWDSYGSRTVQPPAIEQATALLRQLASFNLPQPDVFPVPGGGIQVEFQLESRELEIEILPNGQIEYLTMNEDGQMSEGSISADLQNDLHRLTHWLQGESLAAA
ncbi:MAG: hypothetical protein JST85_15370 [Acidobacteria bacterium]|nr:hypothetical protein [Acidobacteriota bacterium]